MDPDSCGLQIDVAKTSDSSFVALETSREKLGSDELLEASIPKARFTPSLLLSWGIMMIGPFQVGLQIGATGAVKEESVFSDHSSFEWSFCVAIFSIGGLVGSLFAGRVGTIWSRKFSVLIASLVFLVSGLLMMFAANIFMVIVGRFVGGLGAGITGVFMPLYLRELSAPNLRGTLGTGYQVCLTFGIFAVDALAFAFAGKYNGVADPGWRLLLGFPAIFAVLQLISLPIIPESPCWLLDMNRKEHALEVLTRLRGSAEEAAIELEITKQILEHDKAQQAEQSSISLMDVLRDRSIRRPVLIGCALQIVQQLSGINGVMFYANQFFEDAGLSNPIVGTCLVGATNFASTLVALVLMDRAGRRPLLIWSCGGMLVAEILLTFALLSWLPAATTIAVITVLCFVAFFEFGYGPIGWILTSEMLPPAPRASAMSLAMITQWVFTFIIGLVFPSMQSGLGDYTFVPFLVCLAVAFWFTLQCIPETKGMSVEEIRSDMNRRKERRVFQCRARAQ